MIAGTVAAAILKPITLNWAYKRDGYFDKNERGLLLTQEMIRQGVSSGLYLASQLGCWVLSKKLFPQQRELSHFANAFVGSSIIDIVARPLLMAKVSHWFPKNTFQPRHHQPSVGASAPEPAYDLPVARSPWRSESKRATLKNPAPVRFSAPINTVHQHPFAPRTPMTYGQPPQMVMMPMPITPARNYSHPLSLY